MDLRVDNSFFNQDLRDLKVLVFVPHEDDEINTCGAFLSTLSKCGAEIYLVYTTNGDWKYPAGTRMKEAVESAGILGIHENHILFLGYGDSINSAEHNHLFYAIDKTAKSPAGHTETYGTKYYSDYAYLRRGKHQPYTRSAFLEDIVLVLEDIRADIIIATDFDEHPDHRMLSLLFDEAVGIVRKMHTDYCPEIWKRFAYSLSYTAVADYSCVNNSETKRPDQKKTQKYSLDMIDYSIYSWEDRIRIPVFCREGETIRNNLLAKALLKHKTQRIITHADRIINSDEVYWRRRTDNLSFSASVLASSGRAEYLNDFMLFNTDDVDSLKPEFTDYYWYPEKHDEERKAVFIWDEPQHIEQAVLYGSMQPGSFIEELVIRLSDGCEYVVSNIPMDGSPCNVSLGLHDQITKCEIIITSAEDSGYGLSECEFYSSPTVKSHVGSFCKILVDDNFAYEYIIDNTVESVPLGLYRFGMGDGQGAFEIIKGKSEIIGNRLHIAPDDKAIVVRYKCENPEIWDQIVVTRLSGTELSERMKDVAADTKYLNRERKKLKVHNMLYILAKQGPLSVMKRMVKNVILPGLRKKEADGNKVILIGGDHYNGLALVRLFGRMGLRPYGIIVGPHASNGFLKESRYWEKVWTVSEDSEILEILNQNFSHENSKPVIIPWSDGAASMIDNNFDHLKERFLVPSIDRRQSCLYKMMDKGRQIEFANDCGLQIAKSFEINLDTETGAEDIVFPCIGKPIVSCEGDKKDIKKIEDQLELADYLEGLKKKGYNRILLQEYLAIEKEYDIEGFVNRDQSAYFVSEKVRTWPNIGGPTAYAFSVNNPSLNKEIDRIVCHLKKIGYSGLFDVEIFKVGERYLFNEINWRNSAVCFAALYSGVEYPLYWYYSVTGKDYSVGRPSKYGIYSMVELLDFQRIKNREMGIIPWLWDLKRSKAKAYFDWKDTAPLRRRLFLYLKRNSF